jgi:glycosyltransferase involved in cell wall biosynthesis
MIAYAKSKGLTDIVLNSNANLMDEEASKRLILSGLDAIYIGIDAFQPDTYAKIRVGGNYEKAVQNTLHLIKLKKFMNSEKPEVFVQFVEMDINQNEKGDFIRFWNEQGALVKIRPKVSWAGLIDAPNLVLDDEGRWPCYWAMRTMSITDTGKVVTCAVDLDAKLLITAGILTRGKHIEIILESLAKIKNKNLFFLIIGEGYTQADFSYKSYLKELTKTLGLDQRVIFTGWLEKGRLWELLCASDLFVLPSVSEGMPNVMLEALGLDLPCFGSNIPRIKDILHHEGLIFNPFDGEALKQKIESFFSEKDFSNYMSQLYRERKKVLSFNWKGRAYEMITKRTPPAFVSSSIPG